MACFARQFARLFTQRSAHHFARSLAGLLAALQLLAVAVPALAEMPNAPPGTLCVTPKSWCRAIRPGPPGGACACQTTNGWLQGVLR